LKEDPKAIIVMVSSFCSKELEKKIIPVGIKALYQKPIQVSEILKKMLNK